MILFIFLTILSHAADPECEKEKFSQSNRFINKLENIRALMGAGAESLPFQIPGFECALESGGATRCRGQLPGMPYPTNIYLPKGYRPQSRLSAVVHFHGHAFGATQAAFEKDAMRFPFAEWANSSGRVLIVPEQPSRPGPGITANPDDPNENRHKHFFNLARGESFDEWIGAIGKAMVAGKLLKQNAVEGLAITGHSAAFRTLALLAREKSPVLEKVHSVAMFEGYNDFYGFEGTRGGYLNMPALMPLWADRVVRSSGLLYMNGTEGTHTARAVNSWSQHMSQRKYDVVAAASGQIPQNFRFVQNIEPQRFGDQHYDMLAENYLTFLNAIPK